MQSAQHSRRNGSPSSTKQGPMKAVKAFTLKQNSSASSSTSEHSQRESHKLWSRHSPDCRFSPERSPTLPTGSQLWSPNILYKGKLRPSSADTVVPSYLTGQWPKDIINHQSDGVFVCDKSAQTVEVESKDGKKKAGHSRSASFGQGDQLQLQLIKQHLQKSKEGSKYADGKQQAIPIPGSHIALSVIVPPVICLQQTKSLCSARHIPKYNVNRYQRNSVEGLNTEIERLVSSITQSNLSEADGDDIDVFRYEIPDGHRAPGPELTRVSNTRSVDTQTPSHQDHASVKVISRSASISPVMTPRSKSVENHLTLSRSNYTDIKSNPGDADNSPEPTSHLSSPQIQKSCPFVREPPDGCEKVTVVEESKQPKIKEPLHFSPVKPNKFIFKPSQGSAFCPLTKSYELPFSCTGSASPVLSTLSTAIDE